MFIIKHIFAAYHAAFSRRGWILLVIANLLPGCAVDKPEQTAQNMPLFTALGHYHYPVSTTSPMAQRYFDQGLMLAFGFNHAEAARSFQSAYTLDPDCALCYWGAALVLGPNINAPMDPAAVPEAYALVQKALLLSMQATAKEQALIGALTQRYAATADVPRSQLDQSYAQAMRLVARQYSDDALIAALTAEALMDLHPWDFWTIDGEARAWTAEIVTLLETALQNDINNPLAHHLYIHTMEASPYASKALLSAQRLPELVPGSGHLVHMPAHLYIRLGRYHDVIVANQQAVKIDQQYLKHQHLESIYTLAYVPHNHHFLWAAAIKTGRKTIATASAQQTAAHVNQALLREPGFNGTLQHFLIIPLYTQVLFGEWDAILKQAEPERDLLYPLAIWHYARGLALLRQGDYEAAKRELDALLLINAQPEIDTLTVFDINPVSTLLQIAAAILNAELAAFKQDYAAAIAFLEQAIILEDGLNYTEPKDWYLPPRQVLGAILLAAGDAPQAEQVYRQDLQIHPQNGWSLFGLMQSLRAQGKAAEADQVQQQFEEVWDVSEVTLTGSRF